MKTRHIIAIGLLSALAVAILGLAIHTGKAKTKTLQTKADNGDTIVPPVSLHDDFIITSCSLPNDTTLQNINFSAEIQTETYVDYRTNNGIHIYPELNYFYTIDYATSKYNFNILNNFTLTCPKLIFMYNNVQFEYTNAINYEQLVLTNITINNISSELRTIEINNVSGTTLELYAEIAIGVKYTYSTNLTNSIYNVFEFRGRILGAPEGSWEGEKQTSNITINETLNTIKSSLMQYANGSYAQGQQQGYNQGYEAGQTVGYQNGLQDGYDNGYDYGYDDGYTVGENVGYQHGYGIGYNDSEAFNHPIALQPLMLNILTMPFTFISQAFDVTLWPNTPYAFNFSNFIKGMIAIATIMFIIKLFTSGFSILGNYTGNHYKNKLTRQKIKESKSRTALNNRTDPNNKTITKKKG